MNLVLAEQYVLVAEGLGMLLDAEDDLDVLGLAHHSGQAIEFAAKRSSWGGRHPRGPAAWSPAGSSASSINTVGWCTEATQLSYLTVRSHMKNLLIKLGVNSQLEAAAFAVEHGVVAGHSTRAWERHSGQAADEKFCM